MRRNALMFLIIPALALLAACGSETPAETEPVSLTVTARDIAYDTERLEAQAGRALIVTLANEGALEHDFSIMAGHMDDDEMAGHDMSAMMVDPEVHVAAPPGGSNTVESTPATAGEYEYFYTVPGHREAGMSGTLVVSGP